VTCAGRDRGHFTLYRCHRVGHPSPVTDQFSLSENVTFPPLFCDVRWP
jgi:hypothetical protein